MHTRDVPNAFGSPVYYIEETQSTMQEARILAKAGVPDGTVICAGYQSAGRGRVEGRRWDSVPGENLLCTLILRRKPAPGFTLRSGLAVSDTLDSFLEGHPKTRIKWPNDIMHESRKLSGILCESDGEVLYVGTGINIGQTAFDRDIVSKASSLALILGNSAPSTDTVLETYLARMKDVLRDENWNERASGRLWRTGDRVSFLRGDPGRNDRIDGYITGIGSSGELLFKPHPDDASENNAGPSCELLRFFSGEIIWDPLRVR